MKVKKLKKLFLIIIIKKIKFLSMYITYIRCSKKSMIEINIANTDYFSYSNGHKKSSAIIFNVKKIIKQSKSNLH